MTRILVTGAARRVGAAIARRLAHDGHDLVLHAHRSAKEGAALANELGAELVEGDLAKDATRVFTTAEGSGPLDHIINNASAFGRDTPEAISRAALMHHVDVNAWAPFVLTRALHATGRQGSVVNIVDSRLGEPDWEHFAYHLSKRMLQDMTELAARRFAPRIRVNAVWPGPVLPPVDEPDAAPATGRRLPLQRPPTVEALAAAVAFLIAASDTTGAVLPVDGGQHLGRV